MARCDSLEAMHKEQEHKRSATRVAVLHGLGAPAPEAEQANAFQHNWQFLQQHFSHLLATKQDVAELRKTILQLAVIGKLVPQNPADEPASELLKKIATEKDTLEKEGKIKKQKPLPPVTAAEQPYVLPIGWEWVRLGEICDYNGRPSYSSSDLEDGMWILDLEDIEKVTSQLLRREVFQNKQSKSTKNSFKRGDVLYGKLRPYLDKVIVADSDGACTTEIVPIVPWAKIDPCFIRLLLKSPQFLQYVESLMYGVKMPRLGTTDAILSIHPLPPLAEQHRIVAKVDALMRLCDAVEAQLEAQTATQTRLLDAVMAVV